MLKSELRKIYLEKRKELSKKEVDFFSQKIIKNFILQFNPIENQSIHCFLPIEKFNEINTNYLIQYCWEQNIKVFIPKIVGDNLISIELNPSSILEKNSWGILEPAGASFLFILTKKDTSETHAPAGDYNGEGNLASSFFIPPY